MYFYHINQFFVESEFEFPGVPVCAEDAQIGTEEPRLSVRHRKGSLATCPKTRPLGQLADGYTRTYDTDGGVLLCITGDVRIHVDERGETITLDFDEANSEARTLASGFTLGLGMALCALFRQGVPLHAAGVAVDGKLIGIMAPQGAGKSTLLWALLDEGARFASDDLLAAHIRKGEVIAAPSRSLPSRLWKDALEARGMGTQFTPVSSEQEKFLIPVASERRVLESAPLAALFALKPITAEKTDALVTSQRQTGTAALTLLYENTGGLWAVPEWMQDARLFQRLTAMMKTVPIYTLEYPRRFETLPELTRTIREIIAALPA